MQINPKQNKKYENLWLIKYRKKSVKVKNWPILGVRSLGEIGADETEEVVLEAREDLTPGVA